MSEQEVETNDGQIIVITDGGWSPPAGGLYGPDELRDIADALEGNHVEPEDDDDDEEWDDEDDA